MASLGMAYSHQLTNEALRFLYETGSLPVGTLEPVTITPGAGSDPGGKGTKPPFVGGEVEFLLAIGLVQYLFADIDLDSLATMFPIFAGREVFVAPPRTGYYTAPGEPNGKPVSPLACLAPALDLSLLNPDHKTALRQIGKTEFDQLRDFLECMFGGEALALTQNPLFRQGVLSVMAISRAHGVEDGDHVGGTAGKVAAGFKEHMEDSVRAAQLRGFLGSMRNLKSFYWGYVTKSPYWSPESSIGVSGFVRLKDMVGQVFFTSRAYLQAVDSENYPQTVSQTAEMGHLYQELSREIEDLEKRERILEIPLPDAYLETGGQGHMLSLVELAHQIETYQKIRDQLISDEADPLSG